MFAQLSDYLRSHGRASLDDLAHGLNSTPEALQGMLAVLERKGRVQRVRVSSATCSGRRCCCTHKALELYEWCTSDQTS